MLSWFATVTGIEAVTFCVWWAIASICHIVYGFMRAVWQLATGIGRPLPNNTRYYQNPYSVWKGLFMGHVWELAGIRLGEDPTATTVSAWSNTALRDELGSEATEGDLKKESALRDVLRKAAKSTRVSLTSELTAIMTVCSLIAGFMFTKLVDPPQWRRGIHNDLFGLFAGLAFVVALVNIGVCSRLIAVLHWSATTSSLYYVIAVWERAMSANQVNFVLMIVFSFAAMLSACAAKGQAVAANASAPAYSFGVVITIAIVGGVWLWLFLCFGATVMWSKHGVYDTYRALFMQRMCNGDKTLPSYDVAKKTLFWLNNYNLLSAHWQQPTDTACCQGGLSCFGSWKDAFDIV